MAGLMTAMWQIGGDNTHLLVICVVLIAAVLVVQAVVIIAAAVGAMKTQKKVAEIVNDLQIAALPFMVEARAVINKTSELIDDVGPSVRTISRNVEVASANVAQASVTVKNKAQELDELTTEIRLRAQDQVRRVDGMVSDGLTAAGSIGGSIYRAILVPVREITGVVNGIKAGLDTFLGRARKSGIFPDERTTYREDETRL